MAMASVRVCAVDSPLPFLCSSQLLLVIAQLIEQALAQIAAGDAGWIQLADDFDGFVQIGEGEGRPECGTRGFATGAGRALAWRRRGATALLPVASTPCDGALQVEASVDSRCDF